MMFDSHIQGIPCQIEITHYTPPERKFVTCTTIDPPDPGELEFEVLDRKGYRADWLANKMADDDERRIIDEAERCIESEREAAAIDAAESRMEDWR